MTIYVLVSVTTIPVDTSEYNVQN